MPITLQKFEAPDFPYYFQLVNNAKVMAMITGHAIELEQAQRDYSALLKNNTLSRHCGKYKILDSETQAFLGFAKLEIKAPHSTEAELGYMIVPEHWGKGIASSVTAMLIQSAKQQSTLTRVLAIIDPNNIPSRKVLTKNGFRAVGFTDINGLSGEVLELDVSQ